MNQIETLRKMLAEATPGPVRVGADGYSVECDAEGWLFDVYSTRCGEDAELFAAAVNALPALLDAADSLAVLTRYMGEPVGGWAGIFNDDAIDLHIRVRAGDIKAARRALAAVEVGR